MFSEEHLKARVFQQSELAECMDGQTAGVWQSGYRKEKCTVDQTQGTEWKAIA